MATTASLCASALAAVEAQITALETAAANIMSGAILSYTIDTGQTRQTVTKATIGQLNSTLSGLYNRHATLNARCNGAGTVQVRPHF